MVRSLAGAYQYYLFHGGVTAGSENNWYLRSSVPPVVPPATGPPAATPASCRRGHTAPARCSRDRTDPALSPGGRALLGRPDGGAATWCSQPRYVHDRQGDQSLIGGNGPISAAWARAFGEHTDQQWSGAANPSFNGSIAGLQSGLDLFGWDNNGHRDRIGLFAAYGHADGSVRGFAGGFQNVHVGSLALDATSAGGYWTHIGPGGWYVDAILMNTWYTGSPHSVGRLSAGANGTGVTASIEGGYPIPLSANITIEPEAQLIYQHLSLDATQDAVSTVAYGGPDAVSGRIGLRLQGNLSGGIDAAAALSESELLAGLWRVGYDHIRVHRCHQNAATCERIRVWWRHRRPHLSTAIGVFALAGYTTNLDDHRQQIVQGNIGLRVQW